MTTITSIPCPAHCGAHAIKRPTGKVLTTQPPKVEMEWWCACGTHMAAGYDQNTDPDEWTRDM